MLKISFRLKDFDDIARSPLIHPDRLMRIWVTAVKNLVRRKIADRASAENSRSFWQREILQSIRGEVTGEDAGMVWSDSLIAAHVHSGGVIRPKSTKFLAIPIDKSVKRKFARDFSDLVLIRDQKQNRCFLARQMKTKIKMLFVLKSSVNQKPRPFWPSRDEADQETMRVINEDL